MSFSAIRLVTSSLSDFYRLTSSAPRRAACVGRRVLSAARRAAFVDGFQAAVFDVRIDLGRLHAGMAEHFLEGADLGASGQHVCGKAMSQRMGADVGAGPRAGGVFLYQVPN